MTKQEYKSYVGKLCCDKEWQNRLYMVYDLTLKNNHIGTCTPYYSYICLNTGHMDEAACSHFFGAGAYVRFLSPSDF